MGEAERGTCGPESSLAANACEGKARRLALKEIRAAILPLTKGVV